MGEEEVEREARGGSLAAAGAADPEIGPKDAIDKLLEFTEEAIQKNLMTVMVSVVGRSADGSVPDMKFMMEFAQRLRAMKKLPQVEYESFAAVLWREYQALEARERESY